MQIEIDNGTWKTHDDSWKANDLNAGAIVFSISADGSIGNVIDADNIGLNAIATIDQLPAHTGITNGNGLTTQSEIDMSQGSIDFNEIPSTVIPLTSMWTLPPKPEWTTGLTINEGTTMNWQTVVTSPIGVSDIGWSVWITMALLVIVLIRMSRTATWKSILLPVKWAFWMINTACRKIWSALRRETGEAKRAWNEIK